MTTNSECFSCSKGILRREVRDEVYTYKDYSITVPQPGEYCDHCGESFLSNEDLKATQKAIHDLHAQGDSFLVSSDVRRIREKLGFTQRKAGDFFGGGPNAFSRYERGVAMQSKAIDRLLRLYDVHPELLSPSSDDHRAAIEHTDTWVVKKKAHLQVCKSSTPIEVQSRDHNRLVGRLVSTECEQLEMVVNG